MSAQVELTQRWLNTTYGSVSGWVPLDEDGYTGWNTIYGLRRGLQHELGISPVASGFGSATRAAFIAQIGQVDGSTTSQNLLKLVSGSLWCKGYSGAADFSSTIAFSELSSSVLQIRSLLGLGSGVPYVDVKLMAFLMSMDSPTLLLLYGGVEQVRAVEQWLNGTYSQRADFDLCPCDGVFSRQVLTSLLYAVQYEIGMADGTANGNFGPGTKSGLKSRAQVRVGSVDESHHFVRLFQALLRCNGYTDTPFTGDYDTITQSITSRFQAFVEMTANGAGNYSTWCALLVSCGDTELDCTAFDTSKQLTATTASELRAAPFTIAGRYLVGNEKFINATDLNAMRAAGLTLFPIFQRFNRSIADMTYDEGATHAIEALERARTLDLPKDTLVFFAVDFDPVETDMSHVIEYFTGIRDTAAKADTHKISIGVYGTRSVCQMLADHNLSDASFVAGASWGYSGNMGYSMPNNWHYNQIEVDVTRAGVTVDRVRASKRATPTSLSQVTTPPVRPAVKDVFETGFDVVYEWVCRAEARCEQVVDNLYSSFVADYIAHYLRKLTYWDGDSSIANMWRLYTPSPATALLPGEIPIASNAIDCVNTLQAWDAFSFLLGMKPLELSARGTGLNQLVPDLDLPHFAATFLGYRNWGTGMVPNTSYSLGDFGGWALDLLQAWGSYLNGGSTQNVGEWAKASIGVSENSAFGRTDVIADADGYLVAKLLSTNAGEMSGVLRSLLKSTPKQRVALFYSERFSRDPIEVENAFHGVLFDLNIDIPGVGSPKESKLLSVTGASRLPSESEAKQLADGYASVIGGLFN